MGALRRRRNTEHHEVDTEGSWAISYGDMITLLLTFFILFFSTDTKRDRMEAMEASIIAKFDSKKQEGSSAVQQSGQDPAIEKLVVDKLGAQVHKVGHKMIVEFPNTSFFGLGKVPLSKKGVAELGQFVKIYLPYAGNYILGIRAYTDNKKVLANARYSDNLELSALRSVATMRALQKLGIPLSRMRLGGYGELRMTAEDLSRAIASTPEYPSEGLALARKVI